jgi:hypothetical protein
MRKLQTKTWQQVKCVLRPARYNNIGKWAETGKKKIQTNTDEKRSVNYGQKKNYKPKNEKLRASDMDVT